MKYIVPAVIISLLNIASLSGCASRVDAADPRAVVERYLAGVPAHTEVAIAVITPEQTHVSGYRHEDGVWQSTDNRHHVFELGSLTKLYTAYIALQLEQAGIITRHSRLGDYLTTVPETMPDKIAEITLEQLLSHTSGLAFVPSTLSDMPRLNSNPFADFDEAMLVDYLIEAEVSQPGHFSYSNLGYAVAGLMLIAAADTNYATLLCDWVLEPFSLSATSLTPSDLPAPLIPPRNPDGSLGVLWDFAAFSPSGGLYSSLSDVKTFVRHHLISDTPAVTLMRQPVAANTGLAWAIQQQGGRQWLEQTGATGGFTTAVLLDPQRQRAVAILSNVSGLSEHAEAVILMAEHLL